MASEFTRCPVCRKEYQVFNLASASCPFCRKHGVKKLDAALAMMVMPFGKHKGEPMNKVPTPYLEWLEYEFLTNNKNHDLLAQITKELKSRNNKGATK